MDHNGESRGHLRSTIWGFTTPRGPGPGDAHSLILGSKISRPHYMENFPAHKVAYSRVSRACNEVKRGSGAQSRTTGLTWLLYG